MNIPRKRRLPFKPPPPVITIVARDMPTVEELRDLLRGKQ